jgi:hypothetical protein
MTAPALLGKRVELRQIDDAAIDLLRDELRD